MNTKICLCLFLSTLVEFGYSACAGDGAKFVIPDKTTKYNWFEASAKCKSMGMKLVTIEDNSKWQEVRKFLLAIPYVNPNFYWTAGYKSCNVNYETYQEGTWTWQTSGSNFKFTDLFTLKKDPLANFLLIEHSYVAGIPAYNYNGNLNQVGASNINTICEAV